MHEVCAGSDQGVDANDGNRTEKQNHDATHNRYRYGIQEAPQFADEGKQDSCNRCPGHDRRVEGAGQGDSPGDFRVGGVGRAAE